MKNLLSEQSHKTHKGKKSGAFIFLLNVLALAIAVGSFAQESIPLVNPSFEQPGQQVTNWGDVPGWSIDQAANSGVGNNADIATDGEWIAWLMSDDEALWQLTDYTIQATDLVTLSADVRNSWQTTIFDLALYYDDNGTRVSIAVTTPDFEGFVDDTLKTFFVSFSADSVPDAVGKKLGILIDNTSVANSFIEMDNFQLSRNDGTTSVESPDVELTTFSLEQNYPNPFNPETVIRYHLQESGRIKLAVYDLRGRKIRTLADLQQKVGTHSILWNGTNDAGNRVASGVYFYRLTTFSPGNSATRSISGKMTLIQ